MFLLELYLCLKIRFFRSLEQTSKSLPNKEISAHIFDDFTDITRYLRCVNWITLHSDLLNQCLNKTPVKIDHKYSLILWLNINSLIKGTIGYIIVFKHSQGHKHELMTFWMILFQGVVMFQKNGKKLVNFDF